MEVYVEYVFIENFCVDWTLVYLTARFLKLPFKKGRACLSSALGAVFALGYPFLSLFSEWLATVLKATVPFLMCLVSFGKEKRNGRGRYALSVVTFYFLSFVFAGGIFGICAIFDLSYAYGDGILTQAPIGLALSGFVGGFALTELLIKALYERKLQTKFLFPCELCVKERRVKTLGFVDSGNVAKKDGVPICFLSAELFFELFGEESFSMPMEEIALTSLAGEKKIKLARLDEIRIYFGKKTNIIKNPYCSCGYAFGTREYKLLLGSWAFNGSDE